MTDDTRIKRFDVPTLEQLAPLRSNTVGDEELEKVRAILAGEIDPCEASPKCAAWVASCYNRPDTDSYECKLQACDEILGTSGIEALDIEGAPHYTDEGIRMCPPFSYCNAGDTYIATLLRDHSAGQWLVASWGDVLEEYERDEEIGDYEVYSECPDYCPSCHCKTFSLEHFPGSARGPSYSWVCDSCNHHCFAQSTEDAVPIGEDEDGHTVCVVSRKPNGMPWQFEVRLEGVDVPSPDYLPIRGRYFDTPEDARERFHAVMAHRAEIDAADLSVEDDGDDDDDGGDVPGTGDEA